MDIRRDSRIAERAHEYRIEVARQHGEAIRWNGGAVLQIAIGRPVELGECDVCSAGLYDIHCLRDHFLTDAVSGDDRDALLGRVIHAKNITDHVNP